MEIYAGFTFEDLAAIVGVVLTAAAAFLKGADLIAGLTPSNADDEAVGAGKRFLGKAVKIADRLALNPSADKARKVEDDSAI